MLFMKAKTGGNSFSIVMQKTVPRFSHIRMISAVSSFPT